MLSFTSAAATAAVMLSICTTQAARAQEPEHDHGDAPTMATPLGIPMDRMGSGTTWIPDAVSIPTRHLTAGPWNLMIHGFAYGLYDRQGGPRGGERAGSLNWGMFMASRPAAGGVLQLRTMLSLDALTIGARGYPLLLQTGEEFEGLPLHDTQHPHDLFMELGALYQHPLGRDAAIELYAAPAGEPALGPVAFMHRPSAMDDPVAPIGHHWQDATHVSFGVVTAGVYGRRWKLEASLFNGREPDEHRWNLDLAPLRSYSARLTLNPSPRWSGTLGYGRIKGPEAADPTMFVDRVTASVLHGTRTAEGDQWSSALVVGLNDHSMGGTTGAVLLETERASARGNTIFARVEYAQKTAEDLVLTDSVPGWTDARQFGIASASLGYIHDVARVAGATLGVGARGAVSLVPPDLVPFYGSRTPLGLLVFARLRVATAAPSMAAMPGM